MGLLSHIFWGYGLNVVYTGWSAASQHMFAGLLTVTLVHQRPGLLLVQKARSVDVCGGPSSSRSHGGNSA